MNVENPVRIDVKSYKSTEELIENVEMMDVKDKIQESNNNRPMLQSKLGRVTAAPITINSSDENVNPKKNYT